VALVSDVALNITMANFSAGEWCVTAPSQGCINKFKKPEHHQQGNPSQEADNFLIGEN
jgi:hypothetical protein